jgi:hypothetical protein
VARTRRTLNVLDVAELFSFNLPEREEPTRYLLQNISSFITLHNLGALRLSCL